MQEEENGEDWDCAEEMEEEFKKGDVWEEIVLFR